MSLRLRIDLSAKRQPSPSVHRQLDVPATIVSSTDQGETEELVQNGVLREAGHHETGPGGPPHITRTRQETYPGLSSGLCGHEGAYGRHLSAARRTAPPMHAVQTP